MYEDTGLFLTITLSSHTLSSCLCGSLSPQVTSKNLRKWFLTLFLSLEKSVRAVIYLIVKYLVLLSIASCQLHKDSFFSSFTLHYMQLCVTCNSIHRESCHFLTEVNKRKRQSGNNAALACLWNMQFSRGMLQKQNSIQLYLS